MEAIDPETGLANNPRGRSPPPEPQEGDEQAVWDEYAEWTRDRPKYRWKHCKALAAWAPDGVCCATEHEHSKDPMVGAGASNPGELFNIAIGGPTLVRNAAHHKHNMHVPEQHIDDGMRVLDKVFVGLVCTEHRDARGITHYTYAYKLFTARQLAWAAFQRGAASPGPVSDALVPGGINTLGPSVGDFHRMCCVWRLGSVLDAKAGMLPYKCITLNVVIEEWTTERMADEYNRFFGESYYLTRNRDANLLVRREVLNRVTLILDEAFVTRLSVAHAAVQDWMYQDAIDLAQVAAELREWRAVDRAWADERDVQQMRWDTSETIGEPAEPDVRRGPYGPVTRPNPARPRVRDAETELAVREDVQRNTGVFYYEPASGAATRLRERLAAAPAWLRPVLDADNELWATIGLGAALLDSTPRGGNDYELIALADETHTHYMGIRPVLTFWVALQRATEAGRLWPLAQ